MLKILIADDHEVVLRGIKHILQEEFPDVYIDEASDTGSLIQKALESEWDIIITDLSMPGGGGIHAIQKIREVKAQQPILVMSIYSEIQYPIKAISNGASGFLNKDAASDEMLKAVQTVLSGRRYIQPAFAEKMTAAMKTQAGILPHELLSETEYAVMLKLAAGFPDAEIARQMSLSDSLIGDYRSRIMEKIGVKFNADLMRYVIENKLV